MVAAESGKGLLTSGASAARRKGCGSSHRGVAAESGKGLLTSGASAAERWQALGVGPQRRLSKDGQKSTGNGEAPDRGGESNPGAAGRDRARSSRRQYHGLLQELQRQDVEGRRAHHPRR